ncbi:MAG TPA: MBL fold metallo-hydrolase [Pseudonocardiaceae bacterium]|nr:MBL fold metallo-hydrolase [Pseudonocardiaceae bacterium]
MRVHHLNCGTMRPLGGRLIDGQGGLLRAGRIVCHCLLVETDDAGLVLVDAGFSTAAVAEPKRLIDRRVSSLVRPALTTAETALHQVRALGYQPEDVRHIVLTHLDFDHCLGITDFPWAKIHVSEAELAAARKPVTRFERDRYANVPWSAEPDWVPLSPGGDAWFGFDSVRELAGLPTGFVVLPLAGHTRGHVAVAVDTGDTHENGPRWLLHAGDGFFFHGQIDQDKPWSPPMIRLFEYIVDADPTTRLANTERLRELAGSSEVDIVCAHDAYTYDLVTSRNMVQ